MIGRGSSVADDGAASSLYEHGRQVRRGVDVLREAAPAFQSNGSRAASPHSAARRPEQQPGIVEGGAAVVAGCASRTERTPTP